MKYRSKPKVIEAYQYPQEWTAAPAEFKAAVNERHDVVTKVWIKTLEGDLIVSYGDYIVRGIKGEFYPVREDIFLESYERVEE